MAAEYRDVPRKGVCFKMIYFHFFYDLMNCQLFTKLTTPCSSFMNPSLGNLDVI